MHVLPLSWKTDCSQLQCHFTTIEVQGVGGVQREASRQTKCKAMKVSCWNTLGQNDGSCYPDLLGALLSPYTFLCLKCSFQCFNK